MNLEEFYAIYYNTIDNEKITLKCDVVGCNKLENIKKYSAKNNVKRNGMFKCRSCSYTKEGKEKIGEATSYARSEETKEKMSLAKKAFYQSDAGKKLKYELSKLTATRVSNGELHNYRRDWYYSSKNKKYVYYCSSYELRLCWLLDHDENVHSYETQISYEINNRWRCLDFLVKYNNSFKLIEVKPKEKVTEFAEQINDNKQYAELKGWEFQIFTEDDFNMSCIEIRKWADEFRKSTTGIDYVRFRTEKEREKARRHYHKQIATNKIEIYCEYCNEMHNPLRLTYDKNIERNSRYICEKEGGFIAGSKPKKKKENPYAAEGKKQCNECKEIKLFEEFGLDKAKTDGYATRCKKCRSNKAKANYNDSRT